MFDHARWLVPDKVVCCQYSADLTLDDVNIAAEAILDLMDRSPRAFVHILYDLRKMEHMVFDLKEILQQPSAQRFHAHPKLGWSIYVGDKNNNFHGFVIAVLNQKFDAKLRWFETMEAAIAFLADIDDEVVLSEVEHKAL